MFSNEPNRENALSVRGIKSQTDLPDNVTLSRDATNVRFHSAKKAGGYVKKEVDEYIVNVIAPSLEWFQTSIEGRDADIYRLGVDLDNVEKQVVALNRELEQQKMNNMLLTSKRENEEDKEMSALMDQNMELRQQLQALQASGGNVDLSEYDAAIAAYQANETAYRSQVEGMSNYADALAQQLEETTAQLRAGQSESGISESLQAKIAELEADLAEFKKYSDDMQTYTTQLEERIVSLEADLEQARAAQTDPNVISSLTAQVTAAETEIRRVTNEKESIQQQLLTAQQNKIDPNLISSLQEQVQTHEASIRAFADENEDLKAQLASSLASVNNTVGQANETLAQLEAAAARNAVLEAKLNEFSSTTSEYETAYATLLSQYNEINEYQETLRKASEEQIAQLNTELSEAVSRANEYYEHSLVLQGAIDAAAGGAEEEGSLVKNRNIELSEQLNTTEAELKEVSENYAALYEAYNELTESLPPSGIVSADQYAELQVSYDQNAKALEESEKQINALRSEIAERDNQIAQLSDVESNSAGFVAENQRLQGEIHELQLKYDNLLSKKGEPAESDSITYTEEEYTALYTHATEAIEQYNSLVEVHEELIKTYEALRLSSEKNGGAAPAQTQTPAAEPTPQQPKKGGLPTGPRAAAPAPPPEEEPNQASKYEHKKLPEGITMEDLL